MVFSPNWAAQVEVVNVKAYGAIGDGATDDTLAIQSAFNAAFGTKEAPNGPTNKHLNKPVYLPAGNYRVTAPLYLTSIIGGMVYGNGAESTTISLENPQTGNYWFPSGDGSTVHPCIAMNGCDNFIMEGISVVGDTASRTVLGVIGVWMINTAAPGIMTNPQCKNMIIDNFNKGMLVGWPGGFGNCENGSLYNVVFKNCYLTGFEVFGQNTLNWGIYGGGAENCAGGSTYIPGVSGEGAAYHIKSANLSILNSATMINNGWDIINQGAGLNVIGGSSTSMKCMTPGTGTVTGFLYQPPTSAGCVFISGRSSIITYLSSCVFAPVVNDGPGKILDDAGNTRMIIDNMVIGEGGAACGFTAPGPNGNGRLHIRNLVLQPGQDPFSGYGGNVLQYELPPGPFVSLPAANGRFRGRTAWVTDSTTTTPGSAIAGGGSGEVFAYCNGTNWVVIGT